MVITVFVTDYVINGKTATINCEGYTFHNVLLTADSNLRCGKATLKIVVNKRGQLTVLCIG